MLESVLHAIVGSVNIGFKCYYPADLTEIFSFFFPLHLTKKSENFEKPDLIQYGFAWFDSFGSIPLLVFYPPLLLDVIGLQGLGILEL